MCFFCVRITTPVGGKTVTKIYTFCERDGQSPFLSLFHKLDKKLQQKILKGLRCMVLYPSYRTQPHVQHFTSERYSGLYEYREDVYKRQHLNKAHHGDAADEQDCRGIKIPRGDAFAHGRTPLSSGMPRAPARRHSFTSNL